MFFIKHILNGLAAGLPHGQENQERFKKMTKVRKKGGFLKKSQEMTKSKKKQLKFT